MDGLLIEGAQRQLEHLESARRSAPLNERVVACAVCYHLFDARPDPVGRLIIDKEAHLAGHEPIVWSVEQVIIKLRTYIQDLMN